MLFSFSDRRIRRVTRSKEQARKSYDRLSGWYDRLAGASERRWTEIGLDMLDVQPGERVLEIGFGTGRALAALAVDVGESGQVYGLDISPGMLRVSQERLERAGAAGRVELRLGDAAQLPYAGGRMDAVFLSFTLELFDSPEIPLVLAECRRVLRPGGRIGVVCMQREDPPGTALRLYELAHALLPNYVDCRPIYTSQAVKEAGFTVIGEERGSMWGLPVRMVVGRRAT